MVQEPSRPYMRGRGIGQARLLAATIFGAAACWSQLPPAATADTVAPIEAVTYSSAVSTVNGLQMTVWTKPGKRGGAARIAAANGTLWFAERNKGTIVRFRPTGIADVFTIPRRKIRVESVAAGPADDVWFTGYNRGVVGRITASGQIQMFPVGLSRPRSSDMTLGPDGNLWFATNARRIGRTTPGGSTTLFPIKSRTKMPSALTVGSDGNIWFVEQSRKTRKKRKKKNSPKARFDPVAGDPARIGKTEAAPERKRRKARNIARITPSGRIAEFRSRSILRGSYGITTGPDGRIWFCDPAKKRIGRMTIDGRDLRFFKAGLTGTPVSIVTGPDNHMYFGEKEGSIGRISVSGKISEFPIPGVAGTDRFPVQGLTVGPEGDIWFVNKRRSQVGRLRLATDSVDCVGRVWDDLEACGWPGPANAGHPAGLRLRDTPSRTVTADGTVIDGEKITGGLVIAAKNVTVRNSWILESAGGANGSGVIRIAPGASATIVRTTLDGSNATHTGIWYEGASLVARGNNIHGVNDGIFVWDADNFVIEDNYLHDFTTEAGNGHVDGFQTEGASHGIIRHNVFDVAQDQTSAVAIWNGRRDSSDILVENNLMTGGGFTVYAQDYSPSEANPQGGYSVTDIRFLNNKFSNARYSCVGNWGVWFPRGAPTDGWQRLGNIVLETQQNIDSSNPIVNGWECR